MPAGRPNHTRKTDILPPSTGPCHLGGGPKRVAPRFFLARRSATTIRAMVRALLLSTPLVTAIAFALPSSVESAASGEAAPPDAVLATRATTEDPTDAELRAAWNRMDAEQRADWVEWFRAEAEWLGTFQARLVAYVIESEPRDPGTWPEESPAPTYDPKVHAPAQPIARRPMPPGAAADRARDRWFAAIPQRRLKSAWRYDYPLGELRRARAEDEPTRVFENAIAGFPPGLDLAEALVERALDDGSQRATLTAFAHAYSDRTGKVVPGVTLYDVWCSGREMEMPDVECLGVLHDLKDDWKSYRAPVPERKQKALYDEIGALFVPAHRHRGLRCALARTYLSGEPVLRDGYQESLDRLHSLWDRADSTPSKLAEDVPASDDWQAFLEGLAEQCREDAALRKQGEVRRATLAADAARCRALAVRLLREGAYLQDPGEGR